MVFLMQLFAQKYLTFFKLKSLLFYTYSSQVGACKFSVCIFLI